MTDVSKFLKENEEPEFVPDHPSEKYTLTIKEAAAYYGIGLAKLRKLVTENLDSFGLIIGKRFVIIRGEFEEYLQNTAKI